MQSTNESEQPAPNTIAKATDKATFSHKHKIVFVPRWAALIAALAIGLLYMALPERLTYGPSWLLLAIEVVLLLPLMFSWASRRTLPHAAIRILTFAFLVAVTLGLVGSIALLIITLPQAKASIRLLRDAGLLWCTNILVFAFWYWEVDGGGPHMRQHTGHQAADFMFPQQADGNKTGWVPEFIDYLFVAFTGATALSPTDTYPLTRPAKLLMMIEAILSLIVIALLAARAVNILSG